MRPAKLPAAYGLALWQVLELSAITSVRIESRAIGDSHVEPGK